MVVNTAVNYEVERGKTLRKTRDVTNAQVKILFLDDSEVILGAVKSVIEQCGYSCIVTSEPEKAIQILKDESVDIFIVDYLMIGTTGVEVINKVREFNNDVYIILLTGYSENMPGKFAIRNLNIDSYSQKSADLSDLELKVEIAVKNLAKVKAHINKVDGMSFEERLKYLREKQMRTQEDVANYLGVGRSTVGAYENGHIKPGYENIKKLAEYFNVSCGYIMGD